MSLLWFLWCFRKGSNDVTSCNNIKHHILLVKSNQTIQDGSSIKIFSFLECLNLDVSLLTCSSSLSLLDSSVKDRL